MFGVILFTTPTKYTLQPLFPIVAIILIAAPLTALRDRADLERETVIDPLPLRCTGPLVPGSSTAQAAMPPLNALQHDVEFLPALWMKGVGDANGT